MFSISSLIKHFSKTIRWISSGKYVKEQEHISTRMPSKVDDLRSDLGLWKKRGGLCKVGPESSHSRAVISVISPINGGKYMGFTGVKFHPTCRSYNSTYGRMLGGSSQLVSS